MACLLAAFNVVSGFLQRPLVLLTIRYVRAGTIEAKRLNSALHLLWLLLYAVLVLACLLVTWHGSVVRAAQLVGLAVALRAGLFEPVLNHGLGRPWGGLGATAAYDRFRRRLAARLGWPAERAGGWSNVVAILVSAGLIVLLLVD